VTKSVKARLLVCVVIVALVSLFGFLAWRFPGGLDDQDAQIQFVQAVFLISVFLLPSLFYAKLKSRQVLIAILIWGGLGTVLFISYAFRDEAALLFQRLSGELLPRSAQVAGNATVIRLGADGHYAVEALVDGKRIAFLIDTGASDVVLSPRDAELLGFDARNLRFSKTYRTANGLVQGAPVNLRQIVIGSIQLNDVSASVNKSEMGRSLLGMSFLNRLSGFEIKGNSLILKP